MNEPPFGGSCFHPIDSVDDNFEEKACQYNDLLAALESFSVTASYSRKVLNGLSKFISNESLQKLSN